MLDYRPIKNELEKKNKKSLNTINHRRVYTRVYVIRLKIHLKNVSYTIIQYFHTRKSIL